MSHGAKMNYRDDLEEKQSFFLIFSNNTLLYFHVNNSEKLMFHMLRQIADANFRKKCIIEVRPIYDMC